MTNKTEDYIVIFGSFIFMNYILPWTFSYFIKIVGNTHLWTSKGIDNVDDDIDDISLKLKEVYKKRYLLIEDINKNKHNCIIKIINQIYKEYLDRNMLYIINKYSNLYILKNTFENIKVKKVENIKVEKV